ncbi:hypothetical protein [Marixanthomonas spongiae]|uniref:Uncharacterized protein n=1 Tax=Marixanthomonas spongiae TaxID=2174845 RepID=A0A2U0I530_9FLAO|nr:hypothetical protein [Marixanthomonas spongiae]PVW16221.1 hypothetical protein DDV96_02825 [Marixanthomonas spongiae]
MKAALFFTVIFMMLKPLWPIVDYALNYDYIVAFVCENRDKPELECNGTCYLTKELAKEAKDDANPLGNSQTKYEWSQVVYVEPVSTYTLNAPNAFEVCAIPVGADQRADSQLYAYNIPKPPQA